MPGSSWLNDVGCQFRIPWHRVTSPLGTRMNFLTASEIGMRRGGENLPICPFPNFGLMKNPLFLLGLSPSSSGINSAAQAS